MSTQLRSLCFLVQLWPRMIFSASPPNISYRQPDKHMWKKKPQWNVHINRYENTKYSIRGKICMNFNTPECYSRNDSMPNFITSFENFATQWAHNLEVFAFSYNCGQGWSSPPVLLIYLTDSQTNTCQKKNHSETCTSIGMKTPSIQ